jgi:hypothetical protein
MTGGQTKQPGCLSSQANSNRIYFTLPHISLYYPSPVLVIHRQLWLSIASSGCRRGSPVHHWQTVAQTFRGAFETEMMPPNKCASLCENSGGMSEKSFIVHHP